MRSFKKAAAGLAACMLLLGTGTATSLASFAADVIPEINVTAVSKTADASGKWKTVDGKKYFYLDDGTKATMWQNIDGNKYYFGKTGVMRTQWETVGGKKYYFGDDGKMRTMWQTIDGKKYYFGKTGVMRTMWETIGGKKYYFGKTGVMRTMWETIGGKKYYFGKTGVMRTMWETIGGNKYYFGKTGVMRTGFETIGGKTYYFGKSGIMRTMWETISGEKYYFGKTGVMRTGFETIGGKKYFFTSSGALATDGLYGDLEYLIDSKGVCHPFPHPNTGNKNNDARTVASFIANNVPGKTELERVQFAAYIVSMYCDMGTYTSEGKDYKTPYGVFIKGEYTCAGATRALGLVLECMGIKWTHVNENQYTHQWCRFTADGKTAWGDGQLGWADYGKHPVED